MVEAVNNRARFGQWAFVYCDQVAELRSQILEQTGAAASDLLRFRLITPKASERFETCVPLTSLRAAAGRFSDEHPECQR